MRLPGEPRSSLGGGPLRLSASAKGRPLAAHLSRSGGNQLALSIMQRNCSSSQHLDFFFFFFNGTDTPVGARKYTVIARNDEDLTKTINHKPNTTHHRQHQGRFLKQKAQEMASVWPESFRFRTRAIARRGLVWHGPAVTGLARAAQSCSTPLAAPPNAPMSRVHMRNLKGVGDTHFHPLWSAGESLL